MSNSSPLPTFAIALNRLFSLHRNPSSGKEYSLGEVSRETGISVSYLSLARRGGIGKPSGEYLGRLAKFFKVDVSEAFGGEGGQAAPPGSSLAEALGQPLVEDIALRAGQLTEEGRAFVIALMDEQYRRVQELRRQREAQEHEVLENAGDADSEEGGQ